MTDGESAPAGPEQEWAAESGVALLFGIFWYWYLLVAAGLSFSGYIVLNIFFTGALALLVHLYNFFALSRGRLLRGFTAAVLAVLALALLWRESFLAPVTTLASFLLDPETRPTARYLLDFIRHSLNIPMCAAGAVLFAAAYFVRRRKPLLFAVAAYFLLFGAWIMQPKQHIVPGEASSPEDFYRRERARPAVDFPRPGAASPAFDVIILHICSLSWADIKDSGADLVPFFSRFDYVFTDFSAASGYSLPASLRVMKSPCGQVPHWQLNEPAAPGCYLFDDLRNSGFKTYTMFSNKGKYQDFDLNLEKYGHADAPLGVDGLSPVYKMFDGEPLYADDAALHKFWTARQASKAPRAAVYYNTVNLHIGTFKAGVPYAADSPAHYRERLAAMTAQFEAFFSEVESSGRRAVVIFVPEHGAALIGNKMQARDVRNIPLPPISIVPVAVKLIWKPFYPAASGPQVITRPASLQALAWLIAEFLRHNPYSGDARKPGVVAADIPVTEFLAENGDSAVMRSGLGYIYRQQGRDWSPLPSYAGLPPGTIPEPGAFRRADK